MSTLGLFATCTEDGVLSLEVCLPGSRLFIEIDQNGNIEAAEVNREAEIKQIVVKRADLGEEAGAA